MVACIATLSQNFRFTDTGYTLSSLCALKALLYTLFAFLFIARNYSSKTPLQLDVDAGLCRIGIFYSYYSQDSKLKLWFPIIQIARKILAAALWVLLPSAAAQIISILGTQLIYLLLALIIRPFSGPLPWIYMLACESSYLVLAVLFSLQILYEQRGSRDA